MPSTQTDCLIGLPGHNPWKGSTHLQARSNKHIEIYWIGNTYFTVFDINMETYFSLHKLNIRTVKNNTVCQGSVDRTSDRQMWPLTSQSKSPLRPCQGGIREQGSWRRWRWKWEGRGRRGRARRPRSSQSWPNYPPCPAQSRPSCRPSGCSAKMTGRSLAKTR